jgi:hypothetical protein
MMIAHENPPGFVVRTEAQKAAWDNGYRLERGAENGWLHYASTTAPGSIWIAGASDQGPWLLSLDHSGVVAEIGALPPSSTLGPGQATFMLTSLTELHSALDRVYKLAMSLPEAPLDRFKAKTANAPSESGASPCTQWILIVYRQPCGIGVAVGDHGLASVRPWSLQSRINSRVDLWVRRKTDS